MPMTHPDSERLAWERVGALEAELKRTRSQASRAIDVLRAWSQSALRPSSLQGLVDELRQEQLRTASEGKHFTVSDALIPMRRALRGLSMALDESADRLLEQLAD